LLRIENSVCNNCAHKSFSGAIDGRCPGWHTSDRTAATAPAIFRLPWSAEPAADGFPHPGFGRQITEYVALLMICASHAFLVAHEPCGIGVVFQQPLGQYLLFIATGRHRPFLPIRFQLALPPAELTPLYMSPATKLPNRHPAPCRLLDGSLPATLLLRILPLHSRPPLLRNTSAPHICSRLSRKYYS